MQRQEKLTLNDATDLATSGYAPWIEMTGSQYRAGKKAELLVKWGCYLQTKGLYRKENLSAMVMNPDGEKVRLTIETGCPDYYLLPVLLPSNGLYHVLVQNTGCYVLDLDHCYHESTCREPPDVAHAIRHMQCAQVFIPVGHDLDDLPKSAGVQLEIVPGTWKQWRAGDEISLSLLLCGDLLPAAILNISCNGPNAYKQWNEKTDENGSFCLRVKWPGQYLLSVQREMQGRQRGAYDRLFLTTTLFLIVAK